MNDISIVSTMFEEIKHGIKEVENKVNALEKKTDNHVDLPGLSTVESKLDELTGQMLPALHQIENVVKQPVVKKHKHDHTIDIKSSRTFFFMAGLCVLVLGLLFVIGRQWQKINSLADSDIRYRYIKMTNGIDAGKLTELESMFEYRRDNKAVKELRQQVIDYEWALKEQARKLEQAKFKESEAERLRKEADELKTKPGR